MIRKTILVIILMLLFPFRANARGLLDHIDRDSTQNTIEFMTDIFKVNDEDWIIETKEDEFANRITDFYTYLLKDPDAEYELSMTIIDNNDGKLGAIMFHHVSHDDAINLLDAIGVPLTFSLEAVLDDKSSRDTEYVDYKDYTIKLFNTHKAYKNLNLETLIKGSNHFTIQIGASEEIRNYMKDSLKDRN